MSPMVLPFKSIQTQKRLCQIMLQTVQALCKLPGTDNTLQHRLAITTKTDQSKKHCALPGGPGTPRVLLMLIRTPTMLLIVTGRQSLRKRHRKHMKVSIPTYFQSHVYLSLIPYLKETETEQSVPYAFYLDSLHYTCLSSLLSHCIVCLSSGVPGSKLYISAHTSKNKVFSYLSTVPFLSQRIHLDTLLFSNLQTVSKFCQLPYKYLLSDPTSSLGSGPHLANMTPLSLDLKLFMIWTILKSVFTFCNMSPNLRFF